MVDEVTDDEFEEYVVTKEHEIIELQAKVERLEGVVRALYRMGVVIQELTQFVIRINPGVEDPARQSIEGMWDAIKELMPKKDEEDKAALRAVERERKKAHVRFPGSSVEVCSVLVWPGDQEEREKPEEA